MTEFHVRCIARSSIKVSASSCMLEMPQESSMVFFDSSGGKGVSAIAFNPDDFVHGRVSPAVTTNRKWPLSNVDPALELEQACAGENWIFDAGLPQLGLGWVGWLSFECGHAYEAFPWNAPYPDGWDDYYFARYRQAIVWLPDGRPILIYAFNDDLPDTSRQAIDLFEKMTSNVCDIEPIVNVDVPEFTISDGEDYKASVKELRQQIAEGELFQANLSHEMVTKFNSDPRQLYVAIRQKQPTEMSFYWQNGEGRSLISHSPESFLKINGSELISRPIKGTITRDDNPTADACRAAELNSSEKEVSELNMIVDMARNDLGRVATTGMVSVDAAGEVVSYPTLHHREAQVRARWNPQTGIAKLLAATFPPASISGAPKVRALQSIAELEGRSRGVYCGTFGYFLPSPALQGEFSVLIRTACVAEGNMRLAVGAGIVFDSNPDAEWQETLLKGRYLRGR